MAEVLNCYCDESCHLENDRAAVMVLGAVWLPNRFAPLIARQIRQIKAAHGLFAAADAVKPRSAQFEIKWTKVSAAKIDFYLKLVDYFFDQPELHFRAVVIDKSVLDHSRFNQLHDDWYYKMMFRLLAPIIDPQSEHRIYLDIKDTRSEQKRAKLEAVLRNANYDHDKTVIQRVQQIRSHESEPLQLADLLIGAIACHQRALRGELPQTGTARSAAKLALVDRIQQRSGKTLERSTWLRESKFNLFFWRPREDSP